MVDSPLQIGGPGKFSVREDLPASQNYGDRKAMAEDIAGAPTKGQPSAKAAPASEVRQAATQAPVTELFAPSQRPNEPITSGISMGAGPGAESLMMTKVTVKLSDSLESMLPYDTTGEIAVLYQEALAQGN